MSRSPRCRIPATDPAFPCPLSRLKAAALLVGMLLLATTGRVQAVAAARLTINSGAGTISSSSTNTTGSFQLENLSTAGVRITSATIDTATAMLPDVVFDPAGTAGDPDGKAFALDSFNGSGTPVHSFESPHDGVGSEDGYEVLRLTFGAGVDFGPGDTMTFSADIDPTSVKGAPGPGPEHSASISGLELIGATVTVAFSDGTVRSVRSGGVAGSTNTNKMSVALLAPDNLATPGIAVPGKSSPFTSATQPVVRVSGPAGASVRVWTFKAALYLAGVPGGGYDIDPYEVNKVITQGSVSATIGGGGTVDVPLTLSRSPDTGGIHLGTAMLVDGSGRRSSTSDILVIDYDPDGGAPADEQPPTVPGNLVATAVGAGSVTLAWSASSDNVAVTGYGILRDEVPVGTTTQLTFTATGLAPSTTYEFEVEAYDAALKVSARAFLSVATQAGVTNGDAVLRMNAGSGGAFVDPQGNAWSADFGFNGGTASSYSTAISGTGNLQLYQSRRTVSSSFPLLSYEFDLPAGDYRVVLHFVETLANATTGSRVFDVVAGGMLKLDNLDIHARVGNLAACVVEFPVRVSDGRLDLDFPKVASNPTISGIEVFEILPPVAPPSFEAWLESRGLAGKFTEDSDGGGLDNLAEFELQMDPNDASDDLGFRLTCEPLPDGWIIGFPSLKPLGNYHLHRSSELAELGAPGSRIFSISRAEIVLMTEQQRATFDHTDAESGSRVFYQLHFEPALE
jgi:chitodextrinase